MRLIPILGTAMLSFLTTTAFAQTPANRPHNVVLFVADGLRFRMVDDNTAPTMAAIARNGVSLRNSHSLFPTFTTANASGMATGHMLGDTGDFSNTIYAGFEVPGAGNTLTPFLESDAVLGDVDEHFAGNYLDEATILKLARDKGYSTASIGKIGPALIFDPTERSGNQTILVDDATGTPKGIPLSAEISTRLQGANLPLAAPSRGENGKAGNVSTPGTSVANVVQQNYFASVTSHVVLPLFKERNKPFVLVFWSRDPDGSQHNQGDSLNTLVPGINGPTSRAAVRDADDNLRQLLEYIRADAALAATTDVFVTSDHGFATISKHDIDARQHASASASAGVHYDDVPAGFLPPGFLAIDVAQYLQQPLYDPDRQGEDADGHPIYQRLQAGVHPLLGDGLIGGSGRALDHTDADIVVAAGGGSDLIYLTQADAPRARRLVSFLSGLDYVGALFADDQYGVLAGALPLSSIALLGGSKLPRPAIVVSFRTFVLDRGRGRPGNDLQYAVQIADTALQQGQGMHGSFGRDNTFNFMAAIGPDFKAKYRDPMPASNADIAPTLLQLLGLRARPHGLLTGRVLEEALQGRAAPAGAIEHCLAISGPAADGRRTALEYQRYRGRVYADQAALRVVLQTERTGCRRR